MFNVGDRVIGNHYARGCYSITTEGWCGTVVEVNGTYITVQADDEDGVAFRGDKFDVEAYCFDLVECASVDELESAKIDEFFSEFQ